MRTSRTRLDLLVVGHLNLDHEMAVPVLPAEDRTVPVVSRRVFLGGTACNIARWTSRFGVRTGLSSFVGDDLPEEHVRLLRQEKVDLRGLVIRPGRLTPACWILRDPLGRQVTVIDQGAMASTEGQELPSLEGVGWVHLTTGDPGYQLAVARAAHRLHLPIAFDPAQEIHYRWKPRPFREMMGHASLFFGNHHEAERAAELGGVARVESLTEIVPLAVVTEGAKGARAFTRRGVLPVPAGRVPKVRAVTGAGDAFRGGFYAGWLRGETVEKALVRGSRAAATVVGHPRERYLPPLSR